MTTAREAFRFFRRCLHRACAGVCWFFAPVATSVKGALDRNDFRPVIAKAITLAAVAGAGVKAALHDPEVMGALAIVVIAVVSGVLEAISRHQQGATPAALPIQESNDDVPPVPR